jgi:YebC/PmpR family DNA-binding regulatory protein
MAGHSHWANIARKKAIVDNKRGKLWSKLAKAIIVAAKGGGGDPAMNLRLRYAIEDAKAVSMPKDNIQRAIRTGTGELAGGNLEETMYEGYGPGGVAVMCEILTDNRNRTAPEIRKVFEMNGGKLGSTGCVAYLFERKGVFVVPGERIEEDRLLELALEAGADDVKADGDKFEVISSPEKFGPVGEAIRAAGIEPEASQIQRLPTSTVDVDDPETARQVLKLMEALDNHDDVQNVTANFNIPEQAMTQIGAG